MSNEVLKEFANKQRMKSTETETKQIEAPIFGLEKWRKANLPDTPEIRAYIQAQREQKTIIILCVLAITIIVNFIKYGVP